MMTAIDNLAVRLAEEVSPHEADLAPDFVEAYAAGGSVRDDLFRNARAVGAFDAGAVVILMPTLIKVLSVTSTPVLAFLGSGVAAAALDCLKNGLALAEQGIKGSRALRDTAIPAGSDTATLRAVLDTLCTELGREGIPEERVEHIAFKTMRVLLEDRRAARELVTKVGSR